MASERAKLRRGAAGAQGGRRRKGSATAAAGRRGPKGRGSRVLTPWVEGLEDRRLLATITWNTTEAPDGGDWNVAENWTGGQVPGPSDTAVIKGLASPGTVFLDSGVSDSVSSLTTDSSVNLEVINGSLSLGVASSSTLGGPVTVETGASLNVAVGATLAIAQDQTLTDDGALNFAAGDTISFQAYNPATLVVNGTMTATEDTFATTNSGYTSQIEVGAGGEMTASGCTFDLSNVALANSSVLKGTDLSGDTFNCPLYLPYNDVQYLGGNQGFQGVYINGETLPSGTLALDQIGVNTSGLYYDFYQGFTVAAGATVAVGANVTVVIPQDETVTDDGALSFASGDAVSFQPYNPATLVVNGTMTATDTSFATTNSGYTSQIEVNTGGVIEPTGCTFGVPLYLPYNDVQYLGGNQSTDGIYINGGMLPSGTLALDQISVNPAGLFYDFYQGFTVAAGATMAVGANVTVVIPQDETVTDDGALSFASGDAVSFQPYNPATLVVNGTMTATGTSFATTNSGYTSQIEVDAGGEMAASGCTFTLSNVALANSSFLKSTDLSGDTFNCPLYLPYGDVQYLGGNQGFQGVYINGGTLASGTLALVETGVNTSGLFYDFYQGFTVAAGATMAVGANVTVVIPQDETVTDDGALSFASGDAVSFQPYNPATLVVNGTMTATGTSFATTNSGYTSQIEVDFDGALSLTASTYSLTSLTLNGGSNDVISKVVLSSVLNVNSGATINITDNDFSNVPAKGVVASGDANADINLVGNYWGSTVIATIAAKIVDHSTNASLPTIVYQPFISGASGTVASPATATFSPNSQTINLTATVSTTAGVAIDEGTETFTILDGTQVIGQPTAPVNVVNGAATATYTLPGNTPPGQYIIEASYTDSAGNYLPATDYSHLLTVKPAATVTSMPGATATFSATSDQSINLSAQVSSLVGTVNEGVVTFTVLSGGNPVGSPVIAEVTDDVASGAYTLLAGTPGGNYTIQAVYTDPVDFVTSSVTSVLSVGAATTTISASDATANFSAIAGEAVSLSANVSSPAGTVNQGTVTFTILNGSSNQIGQTVVSVTGLEVSTTYALPAGTAPGAYTIEASYNGTASYAASPAPATGTLTVDGAITTTVASDSTTLFSTGAESADLVATVTSPGGPVNTGTVTFTIYNGATPVGTATTASLADNGTASAIYVLPAGTAIGTYTIQAAFNGTADYGGSSDETHSLTITEPSAYQLVIVTGPPATAAAGSPFATTTQPVVVDEEDQYGDLEAGDNSTVVTVELGSGSGPLQGTLTATVVGGVATFTNLDDNTAETITLTFTSGNLAPATSSSIDVEPAAGSRLVITQQPSPNATAGQVFSTQPVVEEVDPYGNVIDDNTDTVTAARGNQGSSALLGDNLTVTLVGGKAAFTGLSYNTAESMDIQFTSSVAGVSSILSAPVLVAPAAPGQLVIDRQPSATATAGVPFQVQPIVYEEDQFGNLELGDSSSQIAATIEGGSGSLLGVTSATLYEGVAHFSDLGAGTAGTISLEFSSGPLVPAVSNSIVVAPAGASQLVIAPGLSTAATAGQPFAVQPVVYLEDANGNIETGDNTTQVTVSLAGGPGQLQGTATVTVHDGIATFAGLYDKAAGTISLEFSATDGLTAGPSPNIAISPGAASQLVIATQPSSPATAGQAFSTQPVVYEEDPYGNIETGDDSSTVTAALASGIGPLQGTTSVTVQGGVAVFNGLNDPTAETITLDFTSGNIVSPASTPIVVEPGTAVGLAIAVGPYASVVAGTPLTDPIVIDEVDAHGNIVTSDNSTVVTASLASGSGTLDGTLTATMHDGVATFNDLEDDTAGTLKLQFTAGTLPAAVSTPSVVTPAAATKLVVEPPPAGAASGAPITVAVEAVDPYGNVDTSYDQPVTIGSTGGTLSGTLTQTAQAGVADFTDLVSTTSGTLALTATGGGGLASSSSGSVAVAPAPPAKLVIQTQPSQTATAGTPFATTAQSVVVREEDQYGNLEAGDSTTTVTAFLGSGSGPLQGTLTATLSGGVATFTNLVDDTAGTIELEFTGGGLDSIASVPIVVSPAAAAKLVISAQPSGMVTAGAAFGTQPVVTEEDQYGNTETGDNSTTITATLATGSGPLQGTTSVVVTDGVATFTNLADQMAGSSTLDFTGGGLSAGPTTSIAISPGPAAKLVISQQPSGTATAGSAFGTQPVVTEEDQYGNLEAGDSTTTVTAVLSGGTGTLSGTTSVTLKGGVGAFTTLAEDTAGTFTLAFTGNGVTSNPSAPFVVVPGSPHMLVVHTAPSTSAIAGQAFVTQPVVYEEDQYGNVIASDDTTLITASIGGGGAPMGTAAVTVRGGVAAFTDLALKTAGTMSLTFSTPGLAPVSTGPIGVSPAAASQWVIHTQPSSTAAAGQAFSTQPVVYEEDPYGNLETGDNSTVVTASLGSGPGPLQGAASVTVSGGVARFAGLADGSPGTIALQFTGGGLPAATSNPITIAAAPTPTPTTTSTSTQSQNPAQTQSPAPTIVGEQALTARAKGKKGKPAPVGFLLQFSEAMNPATAGSSANYMVAAATARHGKKKGTTLKPVGISASYDPTRNAVTLTLSGKQTFASGGEITVIYTPPDGVSSQDGVALDPSDAAFTIQPKAAGIAPG